MTTITEKIKELKFERQSYEGEWGRYDTIQEQIDLLENLEELK